MNSSGAATEDFFAQGLALSHAGQFSDATAAFQNVSKQKPAGGALVNLGLAEWQRGNAGAAVLAWEQARWIDPFDPRARQNLKFARSVLQLDEPPLKWFEAASSWLAADAWVWIASTSLWLAVGALVLPRFFRWRKSGWQQVLAGLGLCFFIFAMAANVGVLSRTDIGYVVKKNTPLLLTPTREGEVILTLNDGEPARKIKSHGNYFLIQTESSSGWIKRDDFGLVCE